MTEPRHLQPFVAAEALKDAYHSYITTSFPLRRPELRREFDRLVTGHKLLWQDPFVSLSRHPRPGRTFAELERDGVIAPALTQSVDFGFERLHDHQSRAITRLSTLTGARSTVVATGTGSGKTEAFLVPILDHCLRNPGDGVRAVVLYPMNALANDQLKRLRRLLRATPGVTFGRFTGEAPRSAEQAQRDGLAPKPQDAPAGERYYREEMLAGPPNILLTNHTMLELLLTRAEERRALFAGAPLQYLVIDEVHTFQGIPGTEVACLIRRLKQHVGRPLGSLTCVGTSATLQTGGDSSALVSFASTLFGEPFDDDSVVVEEAAGVPDAAFVPEPPYRTITQDLVAGDITEPARLRRLATAVLGLPFDRIADSELAFALFDAIERHPLFVEVERRLDQPRPVASLVELLRSLPGRGDLAEEELRQEAAAILLLGASAVRRSPEGGAVEPRFRPKVHLIMRSLSELHRCLDPACGHLLPDGRAECSGSDQHDDVRAALALGVCRTCGQDYWMGQTRVEVAAATATRQRGQALSDLIGAQLSTDPGDQGAATETVFLQPESNASAPPAAEEAEDADPDPAEAADDATDADDADSGAAARTGATGGNPVATIALAVCSICRTIRRDVAAPCPRAGCPGGPAAAARAFLGGSRCPVCLSAGKGSHAQIITPLRSGASSSVSVLATALFDELSDEERRTLVFADSRQDTAHQAGFLRERHHSFARRQLVHATLTAQGAPMTIEELAPKVLSHTIATRGELEAYNLLIPLDSRRVTEEGFFQGDVIPSNRDRRLTESRLRWYLNLEFTALAQQRNALEREGLVGAVYDRIDDLVAQMAPRAAALPYPLTEDQARELIVAVLDVMRYSKAVAYPPFTQWLSPRAPAVAEGEAVPTRYTKLPVGFGSRRASRQRYEIKAWYNEKGTKTAIDDVVARAYPEVDAHDRHAIIDLIVDTLQRARFVVEERIGEERAHGSSMAPAFLVDADRIEICAATRMWRCDACGRARLASLTGADGTQVCLGYRCQGTPVLRVADPESYYVQLYSQHEPKPMLALEHSGQLPGAVRERIEAQFNRQGVNVLVCTPTLELGVDLPDLVALVMRNIPPTPANYAQRAGRAGRERRIALVVSHAGQGPHDSYFFRDPAEMITGVIRPPVIMLDNEVVVRRHINSLILENLTTAVPTDWSAIADDDGEWRSDIEERFRAELTQSGVRDSILTSARAAFSTDQLPWLDDASLAATVAEFPAEISGGLRLWCEEFQRLVTEHDRIKASRRFNTTQERRLLGQLYERMETMRHDREYYPLSFLARAGKLPRYGFPGQAIRVLDDRQRAISQIAAAGITEYAPGNRVYVSGQKLWVSRILFAGAAKEDPQEHTTTYGYCDTCAFMTVNALVSHCPTCQEEDGSGSRLLRRREYIDYAAAQAGGGDYISDDDEYRDRSQYDTATVLEPLGQGAEARLHDEQTAWAGPWEVRRSRRRRIHIFNRGLASEGGTGFTVCLVCGTYRSRANLRRDAAQPAALRVGTGHAAFCHVTGWPLPGDDRTNPAVPEVAEGLHLHVSVEGDVIEIPMPVPLAGEYAAGDRRWAVTMLQALKLGMQLEMFVGQRDVEAFVAVDRPASSADGAAARMVLYDTLPGGTGYLQQLQRRLATIVARAHRHLAECDCERACYRCLKEFWNQRDHALLDKQLILPTLALLAQGATTPARPAMSQREIFDSFVEAELHARLIAAGVPAPRMGRDNVIRAADGRGVLQMDLSWPRQRVVALIDGREFHSRDVSQVLSDQDKRNQALAAGWRILEFTAWEVLNQADAVVAAIKECLGLETAYTRAAPPAADADRMVADAANGGSWPSQVTVTAAALDPVLASLGPQGFAGASEVRVDGRAASVLAVAEARSAALVAVDAQRWTEDPAAWRSELATLRSLTLAGIQCFRMPVERLADPEAVRRSLELAGL